MGNKEGESPEVRKFKDAILVEIFNAYQESVRVYQITTDPEIRQTVLDLKRGYDLAIIHLSPLGPHTEQLWEELRTQFSA